MKKFSQPTVVSTFASLQKPTLKGKSSRTPLNKINLCFVDRLVQMENDKQTDMNARQPFPSPA